MTRQIGEAVAWKTRLVDKTDGFKTSWSITTLPPPGPDNARVIDRETIPLIPASDLTTLTRERDEAVRLLRRVERIYSDIQDGNGNTPTEIRKIKAFLASLPATGGET